MKTAICPGSFDPVTHGHLDIIRRAATLFDKVIVVVMTNSSKKPLFTKEERIDLLGRSTAGLANVEIDSYGGLLAEYARIKNADVIVKGLRAMSDFEYEFQMALANKKLNPTSDTVFLTTASQNMYLSSSLVKQIAQFGGDISDFLPSQIVDRVASRLCKKE